MGIGLFPVFNPDNEEIIFDSDGKTLAFALPDLDAMAVHLGLKPLSHFGLNSELPGEFEFEGDFDKLDEMLEMVPPTEEWFSVQAALETVNGLIDHLKKLKQKDADYQTHAPDFDLTLDELEQLKGCLETAKSKGAEFCFDMA